MSELAARDDLTDDEIFSLVMLLTLAGINTTSAMLALGAFVLLRTRISSPRCEPSLSDRRRGRGVASATVDHPGSALGRTAVENVEIGGA